MRKFWDNTGDEESIEEESIEEDTRTIDGNLECE